MSKRGKFLAGLWILVFCLLVVFFYSERPNVGPLDISVTDVNYNALPYVRVEIENLENGHKSGGQSSGGYYGGPFFEGKHRVVVKLGKHSSEMNVIVYDKIHDFTKGMKTLDIRLDNVRQRFNIETAELDVKIPILSYVEWNDIAIRPHKEVRYTQRTDIKSAAEVELKVLDDIEDSFNTNLSNFFRDFRYVTFIRQERPFTQNYPDYPENVWIYHVIFTNSQPESFVRTGGTFNFTLPIPNFSFTVSQGMPEMNRLSYSSPSLTVSGFTIVETTFETKDFLHK